MDRYRLHRHVSTGKAIRSLKGVIKHLEESGATSIYKYTFICIYVNMYTYPYMCIYMDVYICIACIHYQISLCVYVERDIHEYIYIYIYMLSSCRKLWERFFIVLVQNVLL